MFSSGCSILHTFVGALRATLSGQSLLSVPENMMKIKVLLADDNELMRTAMRRTLEEEPRIQVVGEASNFAKTMQMIVDYKPDVLLLDLHLAEKRDFKPDIVKSQLTRVRKIVAVSFANDDEAKELARSYGAAALLDKMSLYHQLVPAIMQCSPSTHADHGDASSQTLDAD
jgi:DNA-binding NarL/FixJ family response regulator